MKPEPVPIKRWGTFGLFLFHRTGAEHRAINVTGDISTGQRKDYRIMEDEKIDATATDEQQAQTGETLNDVAGDATKYREARARQKSGDGNNDDTNDKEPTIATGENKEAEKDEAKDEKDDTEIPSESGKEDETEKDTKGKEDDDKTQDEDDDQINPDDPKGVQKRINTVTKKRREAERQLEKAEQRNRDLEERLEKLEKGSGDGQDGGETAATDDTAETKSAAGRPNPDDYEDFDDYTEALTEWKANEIVEKRFSEREAKENSEREDREAEERGKALDASFAEAREKYPDFDEVALSEDVQYSQAMIDAMNASDSFTDIAYFLGNNLKIAGKIAHLDPVSAALQIGYIESQIASANNEKTEDTEEKPKPEKKATKAPDPPAIVSGGTTVVEKTLDEVSHNPAAYRNLRHKQKKQRER